MADKIDYAKYGAKQPVNYAKYGAVQIHNPEKMKAEEQQQESPAPDGMTSSGMEDFKRATGMNRTPLDTLQDVGAGALRGGQHIAAGLGEAGQWAGNRMMQNPLMQMLAKKLQGTFGSLPKVNIREEMGLEGENPVDLGEKLASKDANPLAVAVGQYAPAILGGGATLARQAITNGLYGATQAEPGHRVNNALLEGGGIYGAGKLIPAAIKVGKTVFSGIKPKDAANAVQAAHDKLKKYSTDLFDLVGKEAESRGISQIPVDHTLIDEVSEFLPKTRKAKALIDKAKSGSYADLRKLQAELWQRGTANLSSKMPTDHMAGEEIMDLRERINESIGKHFEDTGHGDLNELLNKAKTSYADLKKTFFGKKVPASIKNLVHEESRKVPKNIHKILQEDSKPMERIRASNPLIREHAEQLAKKENAMRKLKGLGYAGGALAGALSIPPLYRSAKGVFGE